MNSADLEQMCDEKKTISWILQSLRESWHESDDKVCCILKAIPNVFFLKLIDYIYLIASVFFRKELRRVFREKLKQLSQQYYVVEPELNSIVSYLFDSEHSTFVRATRIHNDVENVAAESPQAFSLLAHAFDRSNEGYKFILESKLNVVKSKLIIAAAKIGDCDTIQNLLRIGAAVDSSDSNGNTPLMLSAADGNIQVLKLLIRYEASMEVTSHKNYTAVYFCVKNMHLGALQILKHAGADLNRRQGPDEVLLWSVAASSHFNQLVEAMCKNDVYTYTINPTHVSNERELTDSRDGTTQRLLRYMMDFRLESMSWKIIVRSRESMLQALFETIRNRFIAFDEVDSFRQTALSNAIMNADFNVCMFMIESGLHLNFTTEFGKTPLMIAAAEGSLPILEILLIQQLNINAVDSGGYTALMYACDAAHCDVCLKLLDHGAKINKCALNGQTALMIASGAGAHNIVQLLLSNGAAVNGTDVNGYSAFSYAAYGGHMEICKLLLSYGANIKRTGTNYANPLMLAASHGSIPLLTMLLTKGCRINDVNCQGETAAWYAVREKRFDVCKFLCCNDADTNTDRCNGDTLIIHAILFGTVQIVDLLLKNGAAIDKVNKFGMTALGVALQSGNQSAVYALVNHKVKLNQPCIQNLTPIMVAAMYEWIDMLEFFLRKGAAINAKNKLGYDALTMACMMKKEKSVAFLLSNGSDANASILQSFLYTDSRNRTRFDGTKENGQYQEKTTKSIPVLMFAAAMGWYRVVQIILTKCIDIERSDSEGNTALLQAAMNGHTNICTLLIEKGANVNVQSGNGYNISMHAAELNNEELMMLALNNGASTDSHECSNHMSPLLIAAKYNRVSLCRTLLQHGAKVNDQDNVGYSMSTYASEYGWNNLLLLALNYNGDISLREAIFEMTPMLVAAKNGHLHTCIALLENGADINAQDANGYSILMHAVKSRRYPMLKWALENGGDVAARDSVYKTTPLLLAADSSQHEMCALLLEFGSDITAKTKCGHTLLMYSARNGWIDIVSQALDGRAEVNDAEGKEGMTPLLFAARSDHSHICKILIENGADKSVQSRAGYTALMYAADNGSTDLLKTLLGCSVDPNQTVKYAGMSPLLLAARKNYVDICTELVRSGADVNASYENSCSILMYASIKGRIELVELMLKYGADMEMKASDKMMTALLLAAANNQLQVCCVLIQSGANVNASAKDGYTALMLAVESNHADLFNLLLENGASIKAKEVTNGMTPLLLAAKRNSLDFCKALLQRGADVNDQSTDGYFLLLYAVSNGWAELFNLAVKYKANVDISVRSSGKILWLHACDCNRFDMAAELVKGTSAVVGSKLVDFARDRRWDFCAQLISKGANVNARASNGYTVLMCAAENGHRDAVECAVNHGARLNLKERTNGFTALLLAGKNKKHAVFASLILHGADVNASSIDGETPLMYAALNGWTQSIKLLLEYGAKIAARNSSGESVLTYASGSALGYLRGSKCTHYWGDEDVPSD